MKRVRHASRSLADDLKGATHAKGRSTDDQKSLKTPHHLDYLKQLVEVGDVGHLLLKKLLDAPRMKAAWRALASRVTKDSQWRRVWGAIVHAKHQSNLHGASPRKRGEARDGYLRTAKAATQLADGLRGGVLDVPVYNLLPNDVLRAVGVDVPTWRSADQLVKSDIAHRLLQEWPTASEVVAGLAAIATQAASDATAEDALPYLRAKDRVRERVFVWHLRRELRQILGADLNGTVAAITSVVFGRPVTKEFVRSVGGR